jgi:hypothetical protein
VVKCWLMIAWSWVVMGFEMLVVSQKSCATFSHGVALFPFVGSHSIHRLISCECGRACLFRNCGEKRQAAAELSLLDKTRWRTPETPSVSIDMSDASICFER